MAIADEKYVQKWGGGEVTENMRRGISKRAKLILKGGSNY